MSSRKKYFFIVYSMVFAIILLLVLGTYLFIQYQLDQEKILRKANVSVQELYQDYDKQIPIEGLNMEQVNQALEKVKKVIYEQEKSKLLFHLEELKKYIPVRDLVFSYFDNGVLKSTVTMEMIRDVSLQYQKLPKNYQSILKNKIDLIIPQYQAIQNSQTAVYNLFTDNSLTVVREDINRDHYNQAVDTLHTVLQTDVVSKLQEYLNVVQVELTKREEAEARRLAEIARKQREQEIKNAWHILKVPYISQNQNNVLNGCEVASLLMGLQYKGYLRDMSLQTYAENVPKSNDPFSGFTYSIYDLEPFSVLHWIAPGALALYGRNSSGNLNVIDTTGASLLDLDHQVMLGNPVVIYLTAKIKDPKPYLDGAPQNLHVLLLTGYNHITGEQIITDPWTYEDGHKQWKLSRSKVEKIYNATGKRSVVIG